VCVAYIIFFGGNLLEHAQRGKGTHVCVLRILCKCGIFPLNSATILSPVRDKREDLRDVRSAFLGRCACVAVCGGERESG